MNDLSNKYRVSDDEGEILPNLLGLTRFEEIAEAETEGFYYAETKILEEISDETIFDLDYIYRIHRLALEKLYPFAGEPRDVNVSKGGFLFPSAEFLKDTLANFEKDFLFNLPPSYTNREMLITDIASIHAEFLFIHPFREGNGRTARILATAMALRYADRLLDFELITDRRFDEYVHAVQKAAESDYTPMAKLISLLF